MNAANIPYELIGGSPAARDVFGQVQRAAADDRGVLITAEAGFDAEAVARAVYARSARGRAPLVIVECGGPPPAELERMLFGVAHRGAAADELELVGPSAALTRAAGGVLVIGRVHELPAPLQRRLARVLRDGVARTPRRARPVTVDVRVVATRESALDNPIREDLLRRLPLSIDILPLRLRRADIPAIAAAMLAARDRARAFTPAALTVLAALPWRRNTAELARLIERLTASGGTLPIRQEDVLAEVQLDHTPPRPTGSLRDARRQFEREYIAMVLRAHEWHMPDAARALGIERANLYRKARQLGLPLRREADRSARTVSR